MVFVAAVMTIDDRFVPRLPLSVRHRCGRL